MKASALKDWLREHPRVAGVVAVVGALVAGFGAGRLAAPTKVEEKERIVFQTVTEFRTIESTSKTEGPMKKSGHTVVEALPGGGRRTTTDWVLERGPTVTLTNTDTSGKQVETKIEEREKIVLRDAPRLTLGTTVGWSGVPTYGGWASVRVLGPLTLMAQGEAGAGTWSARGGVGLSF